MEVGHVMGGDGGRPWCLARQLIALTPLFFYKMTRQCNLEDFLYELEGLLVF